MGSMNIGVNADEVSSKSGYAKNLV